MTLGSTTAGGNRPTFVFRRKLESYCTVLFAVMLQDMRTRFGGSYLGFLIAIAWPLAHLAVIIVARSFMMKYASLGTDPAIFVATGCLPYILCVYPARFVSMSVAANRSILNAPPVTPLHLLLARSILEVFNSIIVLSVFVFVMHMFGIKFMPYNIQQSFLAIFSTIYLGISLGTLACLLNSILGRFFIIFFFLFLIVLYLASGAYFEVNVPNGPLKEVLSYNPLHHVVAWLRASYFLDLPREPFDRLYVIRVATVCLAIGMFGEKYLRGRLIA